MAKKRPEVLEWQIVEDEAKWQASQEGSPLAATWVVAPRSRRRWWFLLAAVALLIGVAGAGWIRAQRGLATIEAEVQSAVAVDTWLADQAAGVQESALVELGQGWARVQVIVEGAQGGAYRQTRLYQESGAGWLRVAPTAHQWGRAQQWESSYFIIHYFAQDAAAVAAAAPKLDALYATFNAALLTGVLPNAKIVVELDPSHTVAPETVAPETDALDTVAPESSEQAVALDTPITLPSPSAILAPVELAEEEILLQGVALTLFERLAAQSDTLKNLPAQWLPLRKALHMWLLWDQELPLAIWREPLVRWVFWADGEATVPSSVPTFAHDLCAHHRLWLSTAAELESAVDCFPRADGEEAILAFRYSLPPLLLPRFVGEGEGSTSPQRIQSVPEQPLPPATDVAFATLFEYVSVAYGSGAGDVAQVRALLTAIPNHESWETLIPATFELSKRDFEAGWNAFLADRYGVAPLQATPLKIN